MIPMLMTSYQVDHPDTPIGNMALHLTQARWEVAAALLKLGYTKAEANDLLREWHGEGLGQRAWDTIREQLQIGEEVQCV